MNLKVSSKPLKEIESLEKIIANFGSLARTEVVEEVTYKGKTFPIHTVEIGSENPEDPVIGYFGGVHGLEKIGSEVILAFMDSLASLANWFFLLLGITGPRFITSCVNSFLAAISACSSVIPVTSVVTSRPSADIINWLQHA